MGEAFHSISPTAWPAEGLPALETMLALAEPALASRYGAARKRVEDLERMADPSGVELVRARIQLRNAREALYPAFDAACERGELTCMTSPDDPAASPQPLDVRPNAWRRGPARAHLRSCFNPLEDSRLLIGHVHHFNARFWPVEVEDESVAAEVERPQSATNDKLAATIRACWEEGIRPKAHGGQVLWKNYYDIVHERIGGKRRGFGGRTIRERVKALLPSLPT